MGWERGAVCSKKVKSITGVCFSANGLRGERKRRTVAERCLGGKADVVSLNEQGVSVCRN